VVCSQASLGLLHDSHQLVWISHQSTHSRHQSNVELPLCGAETLRTSLQYYRRVQDYHRIAEESHANQMFSADLIQEHASLSGLVLDIAGGTGFNAEFLKISPHRYVCTDLSLHGLKVAREKSRGFVVQADAAQLPIRSSSVDNVLCSWSLEHFPNPEEIFGEMIRASKPGGKIVIWGPNWDNIFRKDFPQFAHKSAAFVTKVRWKIFLKMIRNEFLPFEYRPFTTEDVVAFTNPGYVADDSDATHCVLCQETYKFFKQKGCTIVFLGDFGDMESYLRNDLFIRTVRRILKPLLPVLRFVPLLRWFVVRFPIVVEKP
jgi:ubiquinone/menaquinone biosynthesis C-methylase UbiE